MCKKDKGFRRALTMGRNVGIHVLQFVQTTLYTLLHGSQENLSPLFLVRFTILGCTLNRTV